MTIYNKLVRDKIPELIERNGERCRFNKLDDQMFIKELREKIFEELNEYMSAENDREAIEELADVLEIIHSLSKIHGQSIQEVEEIRRKKFSERGGFDEKLYLIEVEERNHAEF